MCIAVYIPKGIKPPTKAIFKECFVCNSDGAGFGWYDPAKEIWIVSKGHMTFTAFWKAFKAKGFHETENSIPVVCHFRIGTSGKTDHPDCTHPFPICGDYEQMMWHNFETENLAIHNGVLGFGDGDASDTMVWIKNYIYPMYPYLKSTRMKEILEELIDVKASRWLLTKKDKITMCGMWKEDEGIYYSNESYKIVPVSRHPASSIHSRRPAWSNNNHGRGYNWLPSELKITLTIYRFSDYTLANKWSWEKFDRYIRKREEQTNVWKNAIKSMEENTVPNSDDGSEAASTAEFWEVYDQEQNVLAVIDNNGDIIWDDSEDQSAKPAVKNKCPSCGDTKNLVDSNFSQGDFICYRCGAVFCRGTKKVLLWDINIRREFDTSQNIITGGDV